MEKPRIDRGSHLEITFKATLPIRLIAWVDVYATQNDSTFEDVCAAILFEALMTDYTVHHMTPPLTNGSIDKTVTDAALQRASDRYAADQAAQTAQKEPPPWTTDHSAPASPID